MVRWNCLHQMMLDSNADKLYLTVITCDGDKIQMLTGWGATGQCVPGQGACWQDSTDSGWEEKELVQGKVYYFSLSTNCEGFVQNKNIPQFIWIP